jgi:hypothetical protein
MTPVTMMAEKRPLIEQLIEGKLQLRSHEGLGDSARAIPMYWTTTGTCSCFASHETAACHSYHQMANGIRVASIPTMLQFFFAYVYSGMWTMTS